MSAAGRAGKHIGTDMLLARWNETAVYLHRGAVWKISVTK